MHNDRSLKLGHKSFWAFSSHLRTPKVHKVTQKVQQIQKPKPANGFEFSLLTDSTEISSYLNDVYAGDDLSGDRDQCGQPHQMATSCPSTVLSPSVHSVHVILSIAISYPEKCTLPFWKPQPTGSKLVCFLSKGLRKEVSSKCSKSQEHWAHHHLPRLMRIGTERSSTGFHLIDNCEER